MLPSQKNHPQLIHPQRNKSSIVFNDYLSEQFQPKAPQQQSYRSHSQVGPLMTDTIGSSIRRSVCRYSNKICQIEKDYSVPIQEVPSFDRKNGEYQKFLGKSKKFVKPYSECTKYLDNLMNNKQLIRRGAFNLPTEPISVSGLPAFSQSGTKTFKTEHSQNTQHSNRLRRTSQTMKNVFKKNPQDIDIDRKFFDKTMGKQICSYKTLMEQNERNKTDQIKFKNSMNRILAVQMINYHMLGAGETLRPTQSVPITSQHQ